MDKEVVRNLGDEKYYHGFVSQKNVDNQVEMTFLTSSLMSFARWILFLGDLIEIIKPYGLKDEIKKITEGILKRIS